jgi:hypothetical protein
MQQLYAYRWLAGALGVGLDLALGMLLIVNESCAAATAVAAALSTLWMKVTAASNSWVPTMQHAGSLGA